MVASRGGPHQPARRVYPTLSYEEPVNVMALAASSPVLSRYSIEPCCQ